MSSAVRWAAMLHCSRHDWSFSTADDQFYWSMCGNKLLDIASVEQNTIHVKFSFGRALKVALKDSEVVLRILRLYLKRVGISMIF